MLLRIYLLMYGKRSRIREIVRALQAGQLRDGRYRPSQSQLAWCMLG